MTPDMAESLSFLKMNEEKIPDLPEDIQLIPKVEKEQKVKKVPTVPQESKKKRT
jgi:hypothetical protein